MGPADHTELLGPQIYTLTTGVKVSMIRVSKVRVKGLGLVVGLQLGIGPACVNHLGIWPTSIELLTIVFP